MSSEPIACTLCNDIVLRILDHESYLYEDCGLPIVVLLGLSVDQCQSCNTETVSIPRIRDLHRKLAGAVLLKPKALTGGELRFLRTVAGLSMGAFAAQLGVSFHTIRAWETSAALRYLNDVGARIVVATLIAPTDDWSPMFKILSLIKARRSEPDRVSAHWISEQARWIATSVGADYQRQPTISQCPARIEHKNPLEKLSPARLQRAAGLLTGSCKQVPDHSGDVR